MDNYSSLLKKSSNNVVLSFLAAFLFFLYMFFLVKWRHIFEIDPDEGYNLIKALLLNKGYILYKEIWSDQPPLLTYLLRNLFNLTSWDVIAGRTLMICFSSLLIFALFDFVRRSYGVLAAVSSILFLIYSRRFVSISAAIMLGLPSLSMAALSGLVLLLWQGKRQSKWLVLSGALFGLSLSIKLFTAFLIPSFILCIIFISFKYNSSNIRLLTYDVAFWIIGCLSICLICFYPIIINKAYLQLVNSHKNVSFDSLNSLLGVSLKRIIIKDKVIFFLSLFGLFFALKQRDFPGIFLGLWLITGFIALSWHYPIWYHHAFILLIPASGLAGSLVLHLSRHFKNYKIVSNHSNLLAFLIVFSIFFIGYPCSKAIRTQHLINPWHHSRDNHDWTALKFINAHAGPKRTMITSRQIYAFRSNHVVPPFLAVTSRKRYYAGLWNSQTVIDCLKSYKAEMIVLNDRCPETVKKDLKDAMKNDYMKVFWQEQNRQLEIFARNGLIEH